MMQTHHIRPQYRYHIPPNVRSQGMFYQSVHYHIRFLEHTRHLQYKLQIFNVLIYHLTKTNLYFVHIHHHKHIRSLANNMIQGPVWTLIERTECYRPIMTEPLANVDVFPVCLNPNSLHTSQTLHSCSLSRNYTLSNAHALDNIFL